MTIIQRPHYFSSDDERKQKRLDHVLIGKLNPFSALNCTFFFFFFYINSGSAQCALYFKEWF